MEKIKIAHQTPAIAEYIQLRVEVGWGSLDQKIAEKGLRNSIYQVCITENDKLIGYGRLIGDDAFTIYVQDVIVKPSYQRKGIGTKIIEEIMLYIKKNYGKGCMICLLSSKGKEGFYKKYGFIERPNEKYDPGMIQIL